MTHWLLDKLSSSRLEALEQASLVQVCQELSRAEIDGVDYPFIKRTAEALELAVHDLAFAGNLEGVALVSLRTSAADAFRLYRVLPRLEDPIEDAIQILRMCCLGVIGDMGADAARWLREELWPALPFESNDWRERTWASILDVWLRLIRKQGWDDRDAMLKNVADLRSSQKEFEATYLYKQDIAAAQLSAIELVTLYHLAKIAEVLALYITDGKADGNYQIKQLIELHFDRVFLICDRAQLVDLEPLARLLAVCANQMIDNSIWAVTRAVNTKVTEFVKCLVDRGRGNKAIFEVLPPQRQALAEKGLLGSSRRAVVVSLPTSSGKTLIAQFRILQALNQFDSDEGWVAYLAPTRTLVNQVARRLRRDFSPLGITVELVSPALDIDSIEAGLLQKGDDDKFRVLVTTPEKLDLMLRQGWEAKIGRPLTLVVVDEAHNIQAAVRGLRLELLLATINNECKHAQFLLLTPFIENAREVAYWLGGANSDDISLSVDWQPNDRVIGVVQAKKGAQLRRAGSYDYELELETVHTTRHTLTVDHLLPIARGPAIAATYRVANSQGALAAITAQALSARGPVIVMHSRPDWVWKLANKLRIKDNLRETPSESIKLVQDFIRLEFGDDFPLISLLSYGVGVHHAGLSEEIRALMEWLFENNELNFLVATTTIAQGVNFPVAGVVMASHQYPSQKGTVDMPPEDFWNIAGRAGRIDQGSLGIVALVADSEDKAERLKRFVNVQTGKLNSALVRLAIEARNEIGDLWRIVYTRPEWSSFLQYLAHTYQQMGKPEAFADQIELVLRGTLGFQKLREQDMSLAHKLLEGVHIYADYMARPNQPLALVDSTGFSLQSVNTVLTHKGRITANSWDPEKLFRAGDSALQDMMGILLRVPELRDNLVAVTGGNSPDGNKLALIIKDWVNGEPVERIASRYFKGPNDDTTNAMTKCGQNLYGRLALTASWGLGALLSITGSALNEEEKEQLSNLPSRVYYGVNSDSAIALRLLGVPRTAATPLASAMGGVLEQPLSKVRERLGGLSQGQWEQALGPVAGKVYRQVWRITEGIE